MFDLEGVSFFIIFKTLWSGRALFGSWIHPPDLTLCCKTETNLVRGRVPRYYAALSVGLDVVAYVVLIMQSLWKDPEQTLTCTLPCSLSGPFFPFLQRSYSLSLSLLLKQEPLILQVQANITCKSVSLPL